MAKKPDKKVISLGTLNLVNELIDTNKKLAELNCHKKRLKSRLFNELDLAGTDEFVDALGEPVVTRIKRINKNLQGNRSPQGDKQTEYFSYQLVYGKQI